MVSIPESLEALLPDRAMCRGVHQEHNEQHPASSARTYETGMCYPRMTRNSSRLTIMYLHRRLFPDLCPFDVDEVDIVGGGMDDRPEQKLIRDLTVEL